MSRSEITPNHPYETPVASPIFGEVSADMPNAVRKVATKHAFASPRIATDLVHRNPELFSVAGNEAPELTQDQIEELKTKTDSYEHQPEIFDGAHRIAEAVAQANDEINRERTSLHKAENDGRLARILDKPDDVFPGVVARSERRINALEQITKTDVQVIQYDIAQKARRRVYGMFDESNQNLGDFWGENDVYAYQYPKDIVYSVVAARPRPVQPEPTSPPVEPVAPVEPPAPEPTPEPTPEPVPEPLDQPTTDIPRRVLDRMERALAAAKNSPEPTPEPTPEPAVADESVAKSWTGDVESPRAGRAEVEIPQAPAVSEASETTPVVSDNATVATPEPAAEPAPAAPSAEPQEQPAGKKRRWSIRFPLMRLDDAFKPDPSTPAGASEPTPEPAPTDTSQQRYLFDYLRSQYGSAETPGTTSDDEPSTSSQLPGSSDPETPQAISEMFDDSDAEFTERQEAGKRLNREFTEFQETVERIINDSTLRLATDFMTISDNERRSGITRTVLSTSIESIKSSAVEAGVDPAAINMAIEGLVKRLNPIMQQLGDETVRRQFEELAAGK